MKGRTVALLLVLALLISACGAQPPGETPVTPSPSGPATLTIMTHDSFNVSEEVVAAFEQANNAKLQFLQSGDTGTMLNKAILSKDNPLADVLYGVDNTFLSRALREQIFESYASPLLADIPAEFKIDPSNMALPVDYGDVCLNIDKAYFQENNLAPPASLEALLEPQYEGLLVVENPATSSPGLAFLLATIGRFGEDGYLDYWRGLQANGLLVVNDWETAYFTEFSGSSGKGPRPIVVSYGSSPPFEVLYAEQPLDEPPTAAVVADQSCFRQIEFVGILKGSANRALAEKWIDFMLSTTFQEDVPLQMFVFPVNSKAVLDEAFVKFLDVPDNPVTLQELDVDAKRETWIKDWTEAILRQ